MVDKSDNCTTLTIIANGVYSDDWPEIQVFENDNLCGTAKIQEHSQVDFQLQLNKNSNIIRIDYTNKTESSTKVNDGAVVSDQYLEIKNIRLNNILLDKWILTESDYYPNYFLGFLNNNPHAEKKLHSQLIWHFPGSFVVQPLPNKDVFWEWYFYQCRYVYVKQYDEKGKSREEHYSGSLNPLTNLISEIKRIINV